MGFASVHTMPFAKCARQSSVFNIYRFKNLPAKNVLFSCERAAYPSHFFTVFKMSRHRVNTVLTLQCRGSSRILRSGGRQPLRRRVHCPNLRVDPLSKRQKGPRNKEQKLATATKSIISILFRIMCEMRLNKGRIN